MDVTTIEVAREQAKEQYDLYAEAVKKRKEPYLHDLKVLYGAMRTGKVVLDVWQSFRESGLDENSDPKIAVAPANAKVVDFVKMRGDPRTCGWFRDLEELRASHRNGYDWEANGAVRLPSDLFTWKTETRPRTWKKNDGTVEHFNDVIIVRERLQTRVPIVPVAFLPPFGLSNYHVLWEVEKWDAVTPPRDPLLMKRVSPNMFVVLAAWELSEQLDREAGR